MKTQGDSAGACQRTGKWLIAAFAVLIALIALEIVVGILQHDLLAGGPISDADAAANDSRVSATVGMRVLVQLLAVAPLFLRWVYLAQQCACAELESHSFSPALSCWSFFIPLANLVMPYLAIRQIQTVYAQERKALRRAWWSVWVLALLVGEFSKWSWERAVVIEDLLFANGIDLLFLAALACAAILAALLVHRISASILQQHGALEEHSHDRDPAEDPTRVSGKFEA